MNLQQTKQVRSALLECRPRAGAINKSPADLMHAQRRHDAAVALLDADIVSIQRTDATAYDFDRQPALAKGFA